MPFYSFTNGMLVRVACKNVLWSYMWLILSISLQYKLTVIVSAFLITNYLSLYRLNILLMFLWILVYCHVSMLLFFSILGDMLVKLDNY